MSDVWMIVLGMTVVTYVPRLLPFLMIQDKPLPGKLKQFLEYVPFTALGALIVPGVFSAIGDRPDASMVGLAFAVLYGWLRGGIIVAVAGSIGIVYLMLVFL